MSELEKAALALEEDVVKYCNKLKKNKIIKSAYAKKHKKDNPLK